MGHACPLDIPGGEVVRRKPDNRITDNRREKKKKTRNRHPELAFSAQSAEVGQMSSGLLSSRPFHKWRDGIRGAMGVNCSGSVHASSRRTLYLTERLFKERTHITKIPFSPRREICVLRNYKVKRKLNPLPYIILTRQVRTVFPSILAE